MEAEQMVVQHMSGPIFITAIMALVLWLYLLHWLQRLEDTGCKCAMGRSRDFIRGVMIYFVTLNSLILVCFAVNGAATIKFAMQHPVLLLILTTINMGLGIAQMVVMLRYVNRLRDQKCECSRGAARTIMYIVSIIMAGVYAIIALQLLVSIIMGGMAVMKLSNATK